MTRAQEIERRNARLSKKAVRDLSYPQPNANGPGFQSSTERRQAIHWQFPTEAGHDQA